MAETPNLGLTLLEGAQAQKHVTVNEALSRIDAVAQLAVEARQTDPPVAPSEGQRWMVSPAPTGEWVGRDGDIAYFINGGWEFLTPGDGWIAWNREESAEFRFSQGAWVKTQSGPTDGAQLRLLLRTQRIALSGLTSRSSIVINPGATVLAVSTTVNVALQGASNFDVGVDADPNRFASMLGGNAGDSNVGGGAPYLNFDLGAAAQILLTGRASDGGATAFTGGEVTVAMHLLKHQAPSA